MNYKMGIKETIKKLSILVGLFLTSVGALTNDNTFIIIGVLLTIIGEGMFLF